MALEVKFAVTTTNLRFQEDSVCSLELVNAGRDAVQVANPTMTPTLPRMKVVNTKTGVERVYQNPRPGGSLAPMEQPLGPGKSMDIGLMLLDLPGELEPGEYDVSMGCRYAMESQFAESAPVRVKIRPTTPRNLTIEGAAHRVFYGAWVNLAEDPPEIVRLRFDILKGGGARDLRAVVNAGITTVPVLSSPPNGQSTPHHYVAWQDGAEVKFLHLHDTLGPSPIRSIPVPAGEVRIVGPLHSDPTPDDGGRPAGAMLLWMGERDKAESQLQTLRLTESGATAQSRSALPGPKPVWMGSVVRSDGRRTILLVQVVERKILLSQIAWPGTVGSLKKLAEWTGEFVGVGYSLDGNNLLHGSLLFRTGLDPHHDLDRVDFELDAADGFTAKRPVRISIDPEDPVERALVRLSDQGAVAVLLRSGSGVWSLYDGKEVSPLPDSIRKTTFPLDVCFYDESTPILLVGGSKTGFRVLTTAGGPLPREHN